MKTVLSTVALLGSIGFAAAQQSTCTIPASAAVASGTAYTYEAEPCFPDTKVCYPTNYYAAQDQGQFNGANGSFKKQLNAACRKTCDAQSQCLSYVGVLNKAADSDLATGTCFYYSTQQVFPRRCADAPSNIYAYYKSGSGGSGNPTTTRSTTAATTPTTTATSTPTTTPSTTSTTAVATVTPITCAGDFGGAYGGGGCPATCFCDSDVSTPQQSGYCTTQDFCGKQCSTDKDCGTNQFCSPDFNDPNDSAQCGYNICMDYSGCTYSNTPDKRSLSMRGSSANRMFGAMKRGERKGLHPKKV